MTRARVRHGRSSLDRGPAPVGADGLGFRTIAAQYAGRCRRCGGPIRVGDAVRWAPKRGTWHVAAVCGADVDELATAGRAEHEPIEAVIPGGPLDLSAPVPASIVGEVF